jgi:hypothetical protein
MQRCMACSGPDCIAAGHISVLCPNTEVMGRAFASQAEGWLRVQTGEAGKLSLSLPEFLDRERAARGNPPLGN